MTDEFLMQCVKDDDLAKAGILYERYKKKLYRFFLHRNRNDLELSKDGVQQVFYKMIKYRNTYKGGSNFGIWLYTIAHNVQRHDFINQVKKDGAFANHLFAEMHTPVNDDYGAVRQAIDMLPEAYREVLIMSKYMDLKYEDIAAINNCSVGVIKTRVFRAMQSLREVYFKIS